ncbi:GDSL esterase/lipase At5g03610-like [Fagus crenata]
MVKKSKLRFGMNFAYGGTGVFETLLINGPNMTTQINLFEKQLEEEVYLECDLDSSVALVSLAGNDYTAFVAKHADLEDLPAFTTSIINQLAKNLERIRSLGVPKIVVTAIEPMGCLPQAAAYSSYQNCSEIWNLISSFHNQILQQTVLKLNSECEKSVIKILDLYSAFRSAFKSQKHHTGTLKFRNPLKPCCVGVSNDFSCESLDESGAKKYTVCKNPELSFFWDSVHPSQNGWRAVYSELRSSLHQLC